jgi:hypothetical protein
MHLRQRQGREHVRRRDVVGHEPGHELAGALVLAVLHHPAHPALVRLQRLAMQRRGLNCQFYFFLHHGAYPAAYGCDGAECDESLNAVSTKVLMSIAIPVSVNL